MSKIYLTLCEGEADRDESLQGDADDAVDTASETDVDEGNHVGCEVRVDPDQELGGEQRHRVLNKHGDLQNKGSGNTKYK